MSHTMYQKGALHRVGNDMDCVCARARPRDNVWSGYEW